MFTKIFEKIELPSMGINPNILINKGFSEFEKRNFQNATELFKQAKEIFINQKNDEKIALCLAQIALCLFETSKDKFT